MGEILFVRALGHVAAGGGRLQFGVSRCLFAACQKAKSSDLQPFLGFNAHRSSSRAGWFCRLLKMWAQALPTVQN